MADFLFENYKIFTGKSSQDLIEGALWVRDRKIQKVYSNKEPLPNVQWTGRTNGGGKWMLPGLINAHTHIYSTFACGMSVQRIGHGTGQPFAPASFQALLEQLWWKLDRSLLKEDVYYSAKVASLLYLENGITTVIDHHASPYCVQGSGKLLTRALIEEGLLRAILSIETSDRDGKNIREAEIAENLSLFEEKERFPGKMGALFGVHASFTVEEETLKRISELGKPIHIHVGEGDEDGSLHQEKYGKSAVQRLSDHGLLIRDSLFVHAIRVDDNDCDAIKDRGISVVFNPQSNQNNAAGLPDYQMFATRSIPVLLGNDGYGFDFSRDIRSLLISQHHQRRSAVGFSLEDLYTVVFQNHANYASKMLACRVGVLEEGAEADFIVYDYHPFTPVTPQNFLGHWFFGILETQRPCDVVVGGKFLKREGVLTQPKKEIFREAEKVAGKLWNRLPKN